MSRSSAVRSTVQPRLHLGPQAQRAVDLLSDGEWHSYREVIHKVAVTVHPGHAVRRAERARVEAARRRGYRTVDRRQTPIDTADLVRVGSLIIARQTLTSNRRLFEIYPRGVRGPFVDRKVRLRPKDTM